MRARRQPQGRARIHIEILPNSIFSNIPIFGFIFYSILKFGFIFYNIPIFGFQKFWGPFALWLWAFITHTSGKVIASDFIKWNEGRISQTKEQDILWYPSPNMAQKARKTEDTVVDRKMDCNPISQMRALPYWWIWSRPDRCVGYYHHPSVYRDLYFPGFQ